MVLTNNIPEKTSNDLPKRQVRSFVKRAGRYSKGQLTALENYWDDYVINPAKYKRKLNLTKLFGNDNPVVLEIGFGMGDNLFKLASLMPEVNFIGAEVHKPGIGTLLNRVKQAELTNLKIFATDITEVLQNIIQKGALHKVLILFPDPWPKKRHHKRRLINDKFLELLHSKLAKGGQLHLATDWEDYAEQMLSLLENNPNYTNLYPKTKFVPAGQKYRFLTKFEARGLKLGHKIWDLMFEAN